LPEGEKPLENAITGLGLSARAHDRILKVARTIADLDGGANIEPRHLSEAIQYPTLARSYCEKQRMLSSSNVRRRPSRCGFLFAVHSILIK
jgi:hypothetical protein